MKPTDLISLIPAVNNGWTFAAFVVVALVWLCVSRREVPKRRQKRRRGK